MIIVINRKIISNIFQYISKNESEKTIIFGLSLSLSKTDINFSNIKYFIDDSKFSQKRVFNGVEVISTNKFVKIYDKLSFDNILILNDKVFSKCKLQIRDHILKKNITVQNIPINNKVVNFFPYNDFNYILNRTSKITSIGNEFDNKIIFLSGAGGSIGTGIVLQLINLRFKKLILIDSLSIIFIDFHRSLKKIKIIIKLICTCRDLRINKTFQIYLKTIKLILFFMQLHINMYHLLKKIRFQQYKIIF